MKKNTLYKIVDSVRSYDFWISTYRSAPRKNEYQMYADELENNIDDYLWCRDYDEVFEEIDYNLQTR